MSSILDAALSYAASGWLVFPCQPRSKVPATEHGFKDATRNPDQIRAWWEAMPDANVAIATGEGSGLFVLDIDQKQGRTLEDAIEALPGKLPDNLPTVRTGGGGLQYFFAFPKGRNLSISGGKLGLGIDTRGNGGYVVAPPSLHPHGTTYQWIDSDEISELPPTPAWIVAQLERQKSGAILQSAERLTGGRHQTLMTAAALMRGIGLASREIQAALEKMVDRLDLSDGRIIEPKEIRDIAEWTGDKAMGMVNIESVQHGSAVVESMARHTAPDVSDMVGSACKVENPGPFPAHLLAVPGIIKDWTEWINANSFRKQPVLALGAVIAACGALIGRRLRTESGGRANIYVLGLCETGGGKECARQGVKEVLAAAGADALIGPEDLASESGLMSSLVSTPALLVQIDEIGKLLSAITNPQAGTHLVGIVSALLKLYSSAGSIFKGKAYADSTKNPIIQQPHLCLYGTATPDTTWAALGAAAVEDGLLARLWAFVADDQKPPRTKPKLSPPPVVLVDAVAIWTRSAPAGLAAVNPSPVIVKRTPEAELILTAFEGRADDEELALRGSPLRRLWTRAAQKADQLSLIYAWSDSLDPVIDATAAQWAVDMADYLTRAMIWHVSRHVAANQTEGIVKRVLRIIEDAGEITATDLNRRTQWLTGRQRQDTLMQLQEAEQVFMQTKESRGRWTTVYKIRDS